MRFVRTSLLLVLMAGGSSTAAACATGTAVAGDDPQVEAGTDATGPIPTGSVADAERPDAVVVPSTARTPVAGEVIFSELMINPDGVSDELGEWLELYNTTDTPLNLAQCRLTDEATPADDRVIDADVIVPPKSAVVLGRSSKPAENGGISGMVFAYANTFVLANGGDSAVLVCKGATIDKVAFTTSWPFDKGVTMQLKVSARTAAANDSPTAWCKSTLSFGTGSQLGTPGNTANHCP